MCIWIDLDTQLLAKGENYVKGQASEGDEWDFEEGCLSVPGILEYVSRKPALKVRYQDVEFNEIEEEYDGMIARIIQHEYDHLEGILFVDRISNPGCNN